MKFSASTSELSRTLTNVARICSKSPSPSTAGVMLSLDGNTLTIAGFDLSVSLVATLEVKGSLSGTSLVPATVLSQIVAAFTGPETFVDSATEPHRLLVSSLDASASLATLSLDEYPTLPPTLSSRISLSQADLRTAIKEIRYAVSTDDSRGVISSLCLDSTVSPPVLVATDSLRMAATELSGLTGLDPKKTLLSRVAVDELARLLSEGEVSLAVDSSFISFHLPGFVLTARLQAGEYPVWSSIMNQPRPLSLTADVASLLHALRQVDPVAKDTTYIEIKLSANQLNVASVAEQGQASAQVSVEYSGSPVTFRVNPRFLKDTLSAIGSEKVSISFNEDLTRPLELTPAGSPTRHLVMPIRVV